MQDPEEKKKGKGKAKEQTVVYSHSTKPGATKLPKEPAQSAVIAWAETKTNQIIPTEYTTIETLLQTIFSEAPKVLQNDETKKGLLALFNKKETKEFWIERILRSKKALDTIIKTNIKQFLLVLDIFDGIADRKQKTVSVNISLNKNIGRRK